MQNESLKSYARAYLKSLLSECTEGQQLMFKRMYSHKDLSRPIDTVVDMMEDDKLDWAVSQCERTVEKNKVK